MIPEHLKELVDYVLDYAGGVTNDWFTIKKELVNLFPPKDRSKFSRRHFSTKKHIFNEFDLAVINYWEQKTGKKLFIDEEKMHPSDWVQKPKGWGLQEWNKKRDLQHT